MNNTLILGANMLVPFGAIFAMAASADERLQNLQAEIAELTSERDGIVAVDESGEDITEEQLEQVETLTKKIKAKERLLTSLEAIVDSRQASAGRRTIAEPTAAAPQPSASVSAVPTRLNPRGGFKSFGEFAQQVRVGSRAGAQLDQRLLAAATTYGNEGVGVEGGFTVPPEFRQAIWAKVMGEDSLISRCDQITTGGNSFSVPADETTPWDTSNGVQAYWEGEAQAVTASKPMFELKSVRLNKLMALVPVTDELLEDAPGLDSYLRTKAPQKMQSKLNLAIVRGTGVGQPLGIMNAGSLVTVSKESGPQTADTIVFPNIVKMWSRLYGPCRRNAIWIINQDCEPQLNALAFLASAASPVPAYMPANGLSASPYATLMGRPVVPVEACSTLGDVGDIMLVDFSQYMALTKGNDIRTDVSMHLYFDQGVSAYRFTFRVTGQPWWGSTITPQYGSATRSWAVALETR